CSSDLNCATREKDLAWMEKQAAGFAVKITERPDLAMIAVQGPQARAVVDTLLVDVGRRSDLKDLNVFQGTLLAHNYFVARTGYTGEDGYEIILPGDEPTEFWHKLHKAGVKPCGLGARDTLRLEAGMNLYGHEMDENVSPLVANMAWTIAWQPDTRHFIGRTEI